MLTQRHFTRYETNLLGQVRDHVTLTMSTRYISMSEEELKARPLHLTVNAFKAKERENFLLWIREVKMDMCATLLRSKSQRAGLAISKLSGRVREWALKSVICPWIARFPHEFARKTGISCICTTKTGIPCAFTLLVFSTEEERIIGLCLTR